MKRWVRAHKNQKGFVIPMVAICLGMLILFVGFGVDVATWYLQASKIQRAADAASLAGAAKMPDVTAATAAAEEAASKNGFVNGANHVTVTYTPMLPNRYSVQILDTRVPTYFAKAAVDHISLDRKATGEFLNSVPLGSPFSYLGTGPLATGNGQIPAQNYWLAVNGYCTAKEDGDLFLSKYDGNKGTINAPSTLCPYTEANQDYNPEGYNYIFEIPVGGGPSYAQVYDPAFNIHEPGTIDGSAQHFGEPDPVVTTTYSLYDTRFDDDETNDTLLESKTFVTDDPGTPSAFNDWYQFATKLTNSNAVLPHKYRLNVSTKANQMQSWGVNSFGLRAVNNGNSKACDSRKTSTCTMVYGQNAMSVYANLNPSGGSDAHTISFYLARVDAGYAGDPMTVSLWDPGDPAIAGETGKTISLIAPDGSKQPVYWSAVPDPGSYHGYAPGPVDVSGTGPQPGGSNTRFGTAKFNDRRLDLTFQLPTNYGDMVSSANTDWWQIEYKLPASSTPSDRTTWSVTISGSDPVHLVRN